MATSLESILRHFKPGFDDCKYNNSREMTFNARIDIILDAKFYQVSRV